MECNIKLFWQYILGKAGTGWVLGGKPINLKDLAEDLGVHEVTVSKNLSKLQTEGYIEKKHTPYGMIITVMKAKKRFNQNAKPTLAKTLNPP
jgi:DNA-binding MarR family transcriptional regulator